MKELKQAEYIVIKNPRKAVVNVNDQHGRENAIRELFVVNYCSNCKYMMECATSSFKYETVRGRCTVLWSSVDMVNFGIDKEIDNGVVFTDKSAIIGASDDPRLSEDIEAPAIVDDKNKIGVTCSEYEEDV